MTEPKTSHLTRDFLGILTLGFSLLILVSMLSYSIEDPSFNKFSSQETEIKNLGGVVGAHLAAPGLGK